jgi:glutamine amidotransferase
MIAIVDYGLGNLAAFLGVYKRLGIPASVARTSSDILAAERLILPGVGAFDHAMQLLNASGMRDALEERVRGDGIPVLGVCVGMQMLAASSEEGSEAGLGWVGGAVRNLGAISRNDSLPLPHMGWNDVRPSEEKTLFRGFDEVPQFYFLHSFAFETTDAADSLAVAEYGVEFTCAVNRKNVFGVQFHPEKSHHFGSKLLKNFAEV